jgi:hypothetical protein
MASRQEEKEARRQARLEQEETERRAAARKRRVQIVAGALLAAILIAGGVIALTSGGGDGGSAQPGDPPTTDVKLPEVGEPDLDKAAELAGCTVTHPPDEGRGHEEKTFTAADYDTNPPTSGTHFPQWAQDGIYTEDTVPQVGELVHTLEHGRINVQYKPGTPPRVVEQLEAFLAESDGGYHMLLYPNTTDMDAQVAATAWDHMITCPDVTDKTWDALRAFRVRYIDKGPEVVP